MIIGAKSAELIRGGISETGWRPEFGTQLPVETTVASAARRLTAFVARPGKFKRHAQAHPHFYNP